MSPRLVSEVVVVVRTFPIRVFGAQAGPLNEELTWEQLQKESRSPVPLHEYTTVTHKLRRIGRFDWESVRLAIAINRPTRLALNFVDHLNFANRTAPDWDSLTANAKSFVKDLERLGAPVCYIGTGPRLADNIVPQSLPASPNGPTIVLGYSHLQRQP